MTLIDKSTPPKNDVTIIVKPTYDSTTISKLAELPKTYIDELGLVEKIKSQSLYMKEPKTIELFTFNKELFIIKGIFLYSLGDDEIGYEYPYYGIFYRDEYPFLMNEFNELLQVLLIRNEYRFITFWQEPECGKRGLRVYKLENNEFVEVFTDYSWAT